MSQKDGRRRAVQKSLAQKPLAQKSLVQARRAFEAGRLVEAEVACRSVLASAPEEPGALSLLAAVLGQRGAFDAAIPLLRQLLAQNPGDAQALQALGDALDATGQGAAAAAAYEAACQAGPAGPELLAKLAVVLLKGGRLAEAERAVRRAIAVRPDNIDLRASLGTILTDLNRLDDAVAAFREALALKPRAAGTQITLQTGLGLALMKLGRFDEAITAYGTAAALAPERAGDWLGEANYQMALVLRRQGRLDAAAAALEQAAALRPASAETYNTLGVTLKELRRTEQAIACYRRAIELDPRFAAAYPNLGGALCDLGRHAEAVPVLKAAVDLAPGAAGGHSNLANALLGLGRIEEARASYDKAVACGPADPHMASARFNRSLLVLLDGDYREGFAEYEWRRRGGLPNYKPRAFAEPEWQGEDLAGRTILLHAEQGMGDTLQFCRFVPEVEARGGRVVLEVQPPLVSLLAASFPGATVIAERTPRPPVDCHLPLMSLPWRLGTTLDTLPATVPYLAADPAKVALWCERLTAAPGLKVGLVWAGSPKTGHDRQRSLAASVLLPQLPREGVSLFSLQKDHRSGDEAALAAHGAITDLAPLLGDFSDTAAAVSVLDLVITIDSAVAHLAGALGRPTWVLLPYALDWRWLRHRTDSPWYPSARLFRQDAPGAWAGALARLGAALAQEPSQR
jgi:tetratricopeptide (TPR) repeat protein